jgi:AcrR family transcriptional regulator
MQARSRETMSRILESAEALLQTRLFEDLPLAAILRRAGVSVGAFYARFDGKEALVPYLYQRYDAALHAAAKRFLEPERWRDRSLAYRASRMIRLVVRLYRRHHGLMRALALHARTRPQVLTPAQEETRRALSDHAAALLLEARNEIRHPDPELAARQGLFFVLAACRDKILFAQAPHPKLLPVDDRRLAAELSRALVAYLAFTPEPNTPRVAGGPAAPRRSIP